MRTLTIRTQHPYNALIAPGLLDCAGQEIARVLSPCRAVLVTDDMVDALYGDKVLESLHRAGFDAAKFTFPHGEKSKNMQTYQQLLDFLCACDLTRKDILIALGGGVTGDLCGFAAATYLRGVRYVQLPTTLLAMVDSSVGGKTAVDLPGRKNACGAFWQPSLVLCDTAALDTLPEREISNGLAECVKHAVIADAEMLPLTRLPAADYVELAARNIAVKERFVFQDERDMTQRQFLNFGHTAGHAIEALSGYRLRHGECVAIGMVLAARIAQGLGVCAPDVPAAVIQALNAARLPIRCPYGPDALCDFVMHDKKRRGDEITWVLPEKLGQCRLYTLPVTHLPALLQLGFQA